ncbi:MAG: hypothetical protein KatS3mg122_1639 [Caldimonas sp.]|nr:MAG: hypothetical protein KatS3mg122_1639 [Caldimonas sp.]
MRGARARRFDSVRVQTEVCRVCGLQPSSPRPSPRHPQPAHGPPSAGFFVSEAPILDTLAVTYRKVETLIPYARNPRTHSDEQIARIAASIAEFGWTNPILVDGEHGVIAGHGRLLAARKLGLAEVPVIELAHLTPAQKRAYVIADNRLALDAGWDKAMLALEFAELADAGFDLDLTGFSASEIEGLLDAIEKTEPSAEEDTSALVRDPDEDDVTPPAVAVTRPGDLWLLGEHRLLCADSRDAAAVARLLEGERAHLLFTSPPYANQRDYTTGGIADWDALMQGVFGAARAALREDAQILVNLGLVHRDNEWQPYWDGWIAVDAQPRLAALRLVRLGPVGDRARRLGRAAGAPATSSSSTSTDARASRTRSCPASGPGTRRTCAPTDRPPRCAARTARSAPGTMPDSPRRSSASQTRSSR